MTEYIDRGENVEKQLAELHDNLRQILDPDDYGWVHSPTEVVIDDLIMAGVEFEKCKKRPLESIEKCNDREKLIVTLLENNLEVSRVMLREAHKKLEKAEHDRDRYARKIEELTEESEEWRKSWAENQRQWDEAYEKLEAENAEQDEAILKALKHMGVIRREVKGATVENLRTRFAIHFGTYTDKDTVKVSEVFRLLSKFTEEICDTTN